jgi:hypothetical protein
MVALIVIFDVEAKRKLSSEYSNCQCLGMYSKHKKHSRIYISIYNRLRFVIGHLNLSLILPSSLMYVEAARVSDNNRQCLGTGLRP